MYIDIEKRRSSWSTKVWNARRSSNENQKVIDIANKVIVNITIIITLLITSIGLLVIEYLNTHNLLIFDQSCTIKNINNIGSLVFNIKSIKVRTT